MRQRRDCLETCPPHSLGPPLIEGYFIKNLKGVGYQINIKWGEVSKQSKSSFLTAEGTGYRIRRLQKRFFNGG